MLKYNRNYRLEVEGGDGQIHVFQYPMTLELNIQRAALASANTGRLRLYNLGKETRRAIYKDIYDREHFRYVNLMAGYGDNLSSIMHGQIKEAKSFRDEGSTNFVTEIDCYDWSFAMINVDSNWTIEYPQPMDRNTIIDRLMSDLVGANYGGQKLSKGARSDFNVGQAPYSRSFKADGNTWDILKSETNDHCFIDNGAVNCLLDDDCTMGDVTVIDASTGLLSTPKKSEYLLRLDVLFEPGLRIGQQVEVVSASETIYNGTYKILAIQHSGIISGAVNGKCRTSIDLNLGELELKLINGITTSSPVALGI